MGRFVIRLYQKGVNITVRLNHEVLFWGEKTFKPGTFAHEETEYYSAILGMSSQKRKKPKSSFIWKVAPTAPGKRLRWRE